MTGLVGWWPLHENTGSTARDLSGNVNHGTLNGGVTQGVAGKGGLTSYSFDGSDDYVSTGLNPNTSDQFSWCVWIKDQASGDPHIISTNNGDGSDGGVSIAYYGDRIRLEAGGGAGSNVTGTVSTPTNDGRWHHLAGVYDGSNAAIYVDGVGEVDESWSSHSSPVNFDIGRRASDSFYYPGKIFDVRVYNRALSPREIQALYEWGDGDYASPPNDRSNSSAVSRWAFDGDLSDSWGSNDGTDNTSAGYSSNAIRGQAKNFDGSDDYVSTGLNPIPDTFTITHWVRPDNVSSTQALVNNRSGPQGKWTRIGSDSTFYLEMYNGSDWKRVKSDSTLKTGEWYFLAATYDGSVAKAYFNGVEESSKSIGATTGGEMHMGKRADKSPPKNQFDGKMDDVRIYNRALEPHEVFQLYQWGTRGRDMRKLTVNKR